MGDLADTGEVRAAGAVLWRADGDEMEVALVHRPRYDDWTFPKGKSLQGEHPLVTAVREVTEETGTRPVLGRPLGHNSYLAHGRPKRVDYWAATPAALWAQGSGVPGAPADWAQDCPPEFVPNDEVDKLDWLPVEAAARRLSYEHDVGRLREFAGAPASTFPYIFLRHASAVEKERWPDTGLLRPLDEKGRADAWALAELLACFGPARVVSSAAARCVETVLPYCVRVGVPAAAEPVFAVDGDAPVEAATARLAELLAGRQPMILCGHRETLPMLYAEAVERVGGRPGGSLVLGKGSFSVLHVAAVGSAAGRLVAMEQHDLQRAV